MDQIKDVLDFFSMGIKLLSNYYSEDAELRRSFADELAGRLAEEATDENRLLRLDLADCADFSAMLRAICLALGKEEAGNAELPVSRLQKLTDALDRHLTADETCVCLLLENFDLCRERWADADFGWFRNLLYSSDVFSCITVSENHIDLFAHVPAMGSALSNIFTVVEKIGG